MSNVETNGAYQLLADDMLSVIHSRIAAATPVEVLSDRNDKLLQVVEEADGERFVTRSFNEYAVRWIERRGTPFMEAWDAMDSTFSGVGIEVVPSFLFKQDGKYPYVAVSEYLPSDIDMTEVPAETKKTLASGLGELLKPENTYLPSPEMINAGMFQPVKQEDGTFRVVMVDTDPHMIENPRRKADRDQLMPWYVNKFGDLLWDTWCSENERQDVMVSLVLSLSDALGDDIGNINSQVSKAFMNVHMMSNGVDIRKQGLAW